MSNMGSTRDRDRGDSPRLRNAAAILGFGWNLRAFTAADAMSATGLTRTTVIALCDELVERGWLDELPDARASGSSYRHGRPARRYALRSHAGMVVGVDAGTHTITAIAADLTGAELARAKVSVDPGSTGAEDRIAFTDAAIDEAVSAAGSAASGLLCLCIGVPAPVDRDGRTTNDRNPFWARMNPDLGKRVRDRGCAVVVDNDANLAAVAEGALGAGVGIDSYITLVSGERFGAGYVVDGALIRGRGMAGELELLDLVDGVGSSDGIGLLLREWARGFRQSGAIAEGTPLAAVPADQLDAAAVFAAVEKGDPLALELVDRLADRLARICAVLGGLLDVDRIIFAGAVAPALESVLRRSSERITRYAHAQHPALVASTLGSDIVSQGAVMRAVEHVRHHALEIDLS